MARNERLEHKITNVGNRRRRGRFERQPRLELLDQIAFEPVVDAVVPRLLAVEVVRRVKRLVRILNVVADDGAEEDEIARPVRRTAMKTVERVLKIAERLGGTPRQQPVAPQRRAPEFRDGRIVVARQLGEWIGAVFLHTEIQIVIRIFVPPDVPPQIGIDRANHDLGPVVLEKRLELRREQIDRAAHDQPMPGEAPRPRA